MAKPPFKMFPDGYNTTRKNIRPCGCEILLDVDVHKNSNIFITSEITYCRLHSLGVEMMEVFEKEIRSRESQSL